jgi:hypothetical protein
MEHLTGAATYIIPFNPCNFPMREASLPSFYSEEFSFLKVCSNYKSKLKINVIYRK